MQGRRPPGDSGFTLLETMISAFVIGVVMAGLSSFYVASVSLLAHQSSMQVAAQVAASATSRVRSMNGALLTAGRDEASSIAQWNAPVPGVAPYRNDMELVPDDAALPGAGATAALPTVPSVALVNGVSYAQHWYVGACSQAVAGGACEVVTPNTGRVPFFRVVVAVTWTGARCAPLLCSYVTSTLVSSQSDEPVFSANAKAKPPKVINPGNRVMETGDSVTLQLAATEGGPNKVWTFTGLPASVNFTNTGLLTGTVPAGGTYSIVAKVTDAFGLVGTAAFTWTVITVPAVLRSLKVEAWLDASSTSRVLTSTGTVATAGQRVQTWNDRSGNNRHVYQTTAANQMTVGTLNGRQALVSTSAPNDPATTWFTSSAAATETGTFRTVVAVAAPSTVPSKPQTVFASPANQNFSVRIAKTRMGSSSGALNGDDWIYNGTGWTNSITPTVPGPIPTGAAIYVAERGGTPTTSTFSISTSYTDNTAYTRGLIGPVGEVIGFNTTLTAAERRQVEEYLAVKWSVGIAPDAPTALSVVPGNTTGTVSWTAPASAGSSAITGYTVTAQPTDSSLPTATCTTGATPTTCNLTGLTNGAPYTVTVRAANAAGTGTSPSGIELVPYPGFFTAANLGGWFDASFPTTVLTATSTVATSGQQAQTWNDRSGNARNATQGGAANRMTVGTLNGRQALISGPTTSYNSVNATGSFRTIVSVAALNTALDYNTTFAVPANTDFSQRFVHGLVPTVGGPYPTNVNDWSNGTGTPTRVWTNSLASLNMLVSPGIFIAESAVNKVGSFSLSTTFAPGGSGRGLTGPLGEVLAFSRVLTAAERRESEEYLSRKWSIAVTPQAPTITAVTKPAGGSLTVTWTAPAWAGGSAVTGYTVTATAGKTCTAAAGATSCTVTGLTGGVVYPVTMTATNAVGVGVTSTAFNGTA